MPFVDEATEDVVFRIVYDGLGLSGSNTSIQYICSKIPPEARRFIAYEKPSWRECAFSPVTLGTLLGRRIRLHVQTGSGNVYSRSQNAWRKHLRHRADGLIRVVDSQVERVDVNIEYFETLQSEALTMPTVIQYNKRDLPNALDLESLNKHLNPNALPYFESVATTGYGVFDTLKAVTRLAVARARKAGDSAPG